MQRASAGAAGAAERALREQTQAAQAASARCNELQGVCGNLQVCCSALRHVVTQQRLSLQA